MGKASRAKRKRAAVRSAKRAKHNSWWYGITAIVLIAGVSLIMYAHATQPAPVGPYVADGPNNSCTHGSDCHWHAALGVYYCDHWLGDTPGSGVWVWPGTTQQGIFRVGTQVYAGLHSHDDGIIHMEPAVTEEAGRNATVGKYFDFGGWKLSSSGYDFLGTKASNGDKCPTGGAGTLQWEIAKWDEKQDKQHYTVKTGNPAGYKLYNEDIVVIAFLPKGKSLASIGDPPSLKNFPNVFSVESQTSGTMPPAVTVPTTQPGTKTPPTSATNPATTPTTGATSTSKP